MMKKVNAKDIRTLKEQKYHMTGEVHFIRTEDELQEVLANCMQSVKLVMELITKSRAKYTPSSKKNISYFNRTEIVISKLLKHIAKISARLSSIEREKQPVCIPAACIAMECVSKIMTKLVVACIQLFGKYEKEFTIGVLAQTSRLEMMVDFILESSMNADVNDIFYKPPEALEWRELYNGYYVKVEKIESKSFEKKYAEFEQDALTLTAAVSKGLDKKDISFSTTVNTAFNMVYYSIFSSKKTQQAELFLSSPDPKTAANLYNMLDSKYTKPFLSLVLPKIAVNKRIYVPKLLPKLTVKNIMDLEDLSGYLKESPVVLSESSAEDLLGMDLKKRMESHKEGPLVTSTYITHKLKPVPDTHVKIRILSPDILPKDQKPGKGTKVKGMDFDRIIIDIHGGGFISTSTRCHQTYLRKWAKECNAVIFAIDYKLAPEVKYPAVLDDVWQAYFWIITQAESQFGVKMRSIIIAGDSAGGNLAMALTLRTIRSNFRIPDGVLLGYPALNLSIKAFTPSLLAAMDDFILRYSFLNVCINSYIPADADPTKDPYLSPGIISDEDLKKFPPIRIMAAGRDPLRDESYRLMHRLAKMKKDAQMIEYRMFPHAFWSLDVAFGLQECKFATVQAIEWIGKLMEKSQAKKTVESVHEFNFKL